MTYFLPHMNSDKQSWSMFAMRTELIIRDVSENSDSYVSCIVRRHLALNAAVPLSGSVGELDMVAVGERRGVGQINPGLVELGTCIVAIIGPNVYYLGRDGAQLAQESRLLKTVRSSP